MAGQLVKAIAIRNYDLAKEALLEIDKTYINFLYKATKKDTPYTLLDIAMAELLSENINSDLDGKENIKKIILEMRSLGCKTYKELVKPVKGLPPLYQRHTSSRSNVSSGIYTKKRTPNRNNKTQKTNSKPFVNWENS